MGTCYG
jgi:hypothetical protein